MEQQSISISKAGIITTLKARCSVIAAANPVSGRYDSARTFAENVELTDAILSRFDVLCVVRDKVDLDVDTKLANFVVSSHMAARKHNSVHAVGAAAAAAAASGSGSQIDADELAGLSEEEKEARADPAWGRRDMISQRLLKKYIHYAREHCHPRLTRVDHDKISQLYAELRRESMVTGGIPIAVRHIESIIRMSEAHAKMHLRDFVADEDVNVAISVMLESFISSQKFSVMRPLRAHFERFLTHARDQFQLLLFTLNTAVQDVINVRRLRDPSVTYEQAIQRPVELALADFKQHVASQLHINQLEPFLNSDAFKNDQFTVDQAKKIITKRFH
jgi:DNA replication licensing factor MCM2